MFCVHQNRWNLCDTRSEVLEILWLHAECEISVYLSICLVDTHVEKKLIILCSDIK